MNKPAFALETPDNGSEDDTFLAAWKNGIRLSGHPSWFGVADPLYLQRARNKNELQPHVKVITKAIGTVPISQACLVAAMVGFFNPAEGARLAARIDANGIGDITRPLSGEQRIAVGLMIVNYRGW